MDWFAVATGLWGVAAGPVGFWIGRKDRQRDVLPNIRPVDFGASTLGYSGWIEIEARTSEDVIVTCINAAGGVSLVADGTIVYDDGGTIIEHKYHFVPTPRRIEWRIPGNQTARFKVIVDSLHHFRIDLTISSSARTLVDKVISFDALQPE